MENKESDNIRDVIDQLLDDNANILSRLNHIERATPVPTGHLVSYPIVAYHFHRYRDFLNAPVKLMIDFHLKRGEALRAEKVNEDDEIINEIYLPAKMLHGWTRGRVKEFIFTPFDDDTIVFNDAYNTGADMLAIHYLQYERNKLSNCVRSENGRWYIKERDQREDGSHHTLRTRIIPHPGHKCIADLMKWAHCYTFDEKEKTWIYDTDKKSHIKKYLKGVLKTRIADEVGDDGERIADYSKLIYWLMWQQNDRLNQEQRELLKDLVPDSEQITKILQRDVVVRNTVKRAYDEDIPDHYEFEL